jgi:hypothetical protein
MATHVVVVEHDSRTNASSTPGIWRDVQLRPPSDVVYMAGGVRVLGVSPATMHVLAVGQEIPKK